MCGIVAILNIEEQTSKLREKALKMSQKIRHRGPDWSGIYCGGTAILAHERLSIVDPESGGQPLFSPDKKQVLAVNGEIYNHQEIRRRYAGQYEFQTGSVQTRPYSPYAILVPLVGVPAMLPRNCLRYFTLLGINISDHSLLLYLCS